MGTEISYHDLPKDEFDNLHVKYPDGKYNSGDRHHWFAVNIREMHVELIWWMKRERDVQ